MRSPDVTPAATRTRLEASVPVEAAAASVVSAALGSFASRTFCENAKSKDNFVETIVALPFLMYGLNFHFLTASTADFARNRVAADYLNVFRIARLGNESPHHDLSL